LLDLFNAIISLFSRNQLGFRLISCVWHPNIASFVSMCKFKQTHSHTLFLLGRT
jgi:hypothetical protein